MMRGSLGHVSRTPILAVTLTLGAVACSPTRYFHLRGELDRRAWVVHSCEAPETYRVMMTSNQAGDFRALETQAGLRGPELAILEFDAYTLGPMWPWESYETVGVRGDMKLERGTCRTRKPDEH
jgi:hypothetical protein